MSALCPLGEPFSFRKKGRQLPKIEFRIVRGCFVAARSDPPRNMGLRVVFMVSGFGRVWRLGVCGVQARAGGATGK